MGAVGLLGLTFDGSLVCGGMFTSVMLLFEELVLVRIIFTQVGHSHQWLLSCGMVLSFWVLVSVLNKELWK